MTDTTALARRFRIDVDTNYPNTPNWVQLTGVTDFKPAVAPTNQEASDYDTDGWVGYEKTMQAWSADITFFRKTDDTGAFPIAQETLRACEDKFGTEARAHIRWYDRNGAAEAFEGVGLVEYTRANSGAKDLDAAQVKITGDGERIAITNPLA